jgi:pyruvate/2-oxoglutarate dehydrogenase complex dihydrolipoamide dehydrogenase (E3) component
MHRNRPAPGLHDWSNSTNWIVRRWRANPDGLVKFHVRAGSDRILRAIVAARHAGKVISDLTLSVMGGLGLRTLARTIHSNRRRREPASASPAPATV